MTLEQLKTELAALAENHGACKHWLYALYNCQRQEEMNRLIEAHSFWLGKNLPLDDLMYLLPDFLDKYRCGKEGVACSLMTPPEILILLAKQNNPWGKYYALKNPNYAKQ